MSKTKIEKYITAYQFLCTHWDSCHTLHIWLSAGVIDLMILLHSTLCLACRCLRQNDGYHMKVLMLRKSPVYMSG